MITDAIINDMEREVGAANTRYALYRHAERENTPQARAAYQRACELFPEPPPQPWANVYNSADHD